MSNVTAMTGKLRQTEARLKRHDMGWMWDCGMIATADSGGVLAGGELWGALCGGALQHSCSVAERAAPHSPPKSLQHCQGVSATTHHSLYSALMHESCSFILCASSKIKSLHGARNSARRQCAVEAVLCMVHPKINTVSACRVV